MIRVLYIVLLLVLLVKLKTTPNQLCLDIITTEITSTEPPLQNTLQLPPLMLYEEFIPTIYLDTNYSVYLRFFLFRRPRDRL